jgi:hypothetical protein
MVAIFKCPTCKHVQRFNDENLKEDWKGLLVLNGKPFKPICPKCKTKMKGGLLRTKESKAKSKCNSSCINATNCVCCCSCNGINHGKAHEI